MASAVVTTVPRRPVQFPPGTAGRELLRPTNTPLWLDYGGFVNGQPVGGTRYRRHITRDNPFLFAVTYFGRFLRDPETDDMSFCQFQLDAYQRARAWPLRGAQHDVTVASRGAQKSTLYFRILPLWALAHGHHQFFCAFSRIGDQAKKHLANLLNIVHGRAGQMSELLLRDYPELVPVRGAGAPGVTVLTGDGRGRRAIGAYGIHESTLGLNVDGMRPTLMVGDDLQRGGDKWTREEKADTLTAITENILPMGGSRGSVVQIVGTSVASGCLIHDAVRVAKGELSRSWLHDARFRAHYYPAIVDEGLPSERSFWPQAFPLDVLKRDRYNDDGTLNRAFALSRMNDPVRDESGAYWSGEFRYLPRFYPRRWVCWVDPAKSTHGTSDWTAYVVAALLQTQKPAVVVVAADQGHWSYLETRQRLDVLRGRFEGLQVFGEQNTFGSEENARNLLGLKRSDRAPWTKASKEVRIRAAADVYHEGLAVHAQQLAKLEDELTGYPGPRDDLPDALAGALGVLLPGRIPTE